MKEGEIIYSVIIENIMLVKVADVIEFCRETTKYSDDISITAHQNKYIVDAKSTIGLFSLDLTEPFTLILESTNELDRDKIYKDFQVYVTPYITK